MGEPWRGPRPVARDVIRFTVTGRARAKGSKRAICKRDAAGRPIGEPWLIEQNAGRIEKWRKLVKAAALQHRPDALLDGPLSIRCVYYFERFGSHFHKSRKRAGELREDAPPTPYKRNHGGDIDKLQRTVFDALAGVLYRDDSQIVEESAAKLWGSPERAEIEVRAIDEAGRPPQESGPDAQHVRTRVPCDAVTYGGQGPR